jgi:phage portal protein BeeE
VQGAVTL